VIQDVQSDQRYSPYVQRTLKVYLKNLIAVKYDSAKGREGVVIFANKEGGKQ